MFSSICPVTAVPYIAWHGIVCVAQVSTEQRRRLNMGLWEIRSTESHLRKGRESCALRAESHPEPPPGAPPCSVRPFAPARGPRDAAVLGADSGQPGLPTAPPGTESRSSQLLAGALSLSMGAARRPHGARDAQTAFAALVSPAAGKARGACFPSGADSAAPRNGRGHPDGSPRRV